MRKRFKSTLSIIFVLIIICACIGIGYLFYNGVVEHDADIVVDGSLTMNYLDGQSFELEGNHTITFSVTNNSSTQLYYYIQFTDVGGEATYSLTSSEIDLSGDLKSDIILNQVDIDGFTTTTYKLTLSGTSYSGKVVIGLRSNEESIFSDVILSDNSVSDTTISPVGDASTVNEGLISSSDDGGIAYYFRGSVENNNVYFAGYNWKIVKINGDGSVKLVLDGVIDELSSYSDGTINYEESDIVDVLDDWYQENLFEYSSYIAYNKYCNDTVLESDGITFASFSRIVTNKIPTFVCLGNTINARIGLLTADEVMLAGGSSSENSSYYLYNSDITTSYYTMSSAVYSNNTYYPFVVSTNGAIITNTSSTLLRAVRPVINIIKNAKVSGSGTVNDPYEILEED